MLQVLQVMVGRTKFRKVLPASQTALAVLFGGWGLWIRNSILSQPLFWKFNAVELHGTISRLALAIQIRCDSKHASISRKWSAVMASRLPPAGATGMGLSLTSAAACMVALVLHRVVDGQKRQF